jgi:hypothetical protein
MEEIIYAEARFIAQSNKMPISKMKEIKSEFSSPTTSRATIIDIHQVGYCSFNVVSPRWIMYSM